MTASTSPIPLSRRRRPLPASVALLLTLAGNMLVVGILAVGAAGVVVAALAVFGPGILDAL